MYQGGLAISYIAVTWTFIICTTIYSF